MKRLKAIAKAIWRFYSGLTVLAAAYLTIFLFVGILALTAMAVDAFENAKFRHLSAAEHVRLAKLAYDQKDFSESTRHLVAVPSNGPEREKASALLAVIQEEQQKLNRIHQEQVARQIEAGRERMLGNIQGRFHDDFICSVSTAHKPIMSFDAGVTWWADDGRCAAREQKRRDEDAGVYSYLPSTIRVDTDMDSYWLNNEERICQTYPNAKGRVAVVACNQTGSHRDHNIPVKFWGGVDRNTISDWKCRREGEDFVCRALN